MCMCVYTHTHISQLQSDFIYFITRIIVISFFENIRFNHSSFSINKFISITFINYSDKIIESPFFVFISFFFND